MTSLKGSYKQLNELKVTLKNFFRCKLCHKIPKENNKLVSFSKCSDLFCDDCIVSINRAGNCPHCKLGSLDTVPISNQMLSEAFEFICNLSSKIDRQLSQTKENSGQQVKPIKQINENLSKTKSTPLKHKPKKISDKTTNNSTVTVEKAKVHLAQPLSEIGLQPAAGHDHFRPADNNVASRHLPKRIPVKRTTFVLDSKSAENLERKRPDKAGSADELMASPAKKTRMEMPEAVVTVGDTVKVKETGTPVKDTGTVVVNPVTKPSMNNTTTPGASSVTPKVQCGTTNELEAPIQSDKSLIIPKSVRQKRKRNKQGETKLMTACIKADLDAVTALLADGDDVNAQDNAKWTPLLEAAHYGFVNIVEKLLDSGAFINLPGGPASDTPLHDAVGNNHIEVVKLLLQRGANKTIRNSWGQIPSDLTDSEEMKDVLKEVVVSKPVAPIVPPVSCHKPVVVLGDNLGKRELTLLRNVVKKCKWRLVYKYSANVTHIVTAMTEQLCVPTFNILCGILQGKWILNQIWLKKCEEDKDSVLLRSELFEALGTSNFGYTKATLRASLMNSDGKFPGLFHGCHIFVTPQMGSYKVGDLELSKADLRDLIRCGEGTYLSREPRAEDIPRSQCTVPYHAKAGGSLTLCAHYILYQTGKHEPLMKYKMGHIKSLPLEWFIDCIARFELVDSNKYIQE